eukprot:754933-Hanusia_phi.AAC.12
MACMVPSDSSMMIATSKMECGRFLSALLVRSTCYDPRVAAHHCGRWHYMYADRSAMLCGPGAICCLTESDVTHMLLTIRCSYASDALDGAIPTTAQRNLMNPIPTLNTS